MMVGGLFKGKSGLEDLFLLEMVSQYLQAYGQSLSTETAGQREAWNAGQVGRNSEDIGQVHL